MRFRKKPLVIEAMKWDGTDLRAAAIYDWSDGHFYCDLRDNQVVATLDGTMTASPGDWIIRGTNGEYYPCKPDIFEANYEPLEGG